MINDVMQLSDREKGGECWLVRPSSYWGTFLPPLISFRSPHPGTFTPISYFACHSGDALKNGRNGSGLRLNHHRRTGIEGPRADIGHRPGEDLLRADTKFVACFRNPARSHGIVRLFPSTTKISANLRRNHFHPSFHGFGHLIVVGKAMRNYPSDAYGHYLPLILAKECPETDVLGPGVLYLDTWPISSPMIQSFPS